jgi:hypothetical protein
VRRSSPFLVLLLVTAASCGSPDRSEPSGQSADVAQPRMQYDASDAAASNAAAPEEAAQRAAAGPNVGPTAAPGVAFNYRYAFRLAAQRIAEVQEQHAQVCERLTIARCRITGMHYRVVNDRDIEAMLAFKLDPAVARHFGREGVQAVVRAEGMLTESEISGTDVGTTIRAAGRSLAELEADLARIEARIRAARPADKSTLEYEAQQLRAQIRALRESRDAQQASLATTPMVFRYGSGDLVPGFGQRPTISQSLQRAGDNFVDGATMVLIVAITLLPWALALGLIWLGARAVRRRWPGERPNALEVSPQPAP